MKSPLTLASVATIICGLLLLPSCINQNADSITVPVRDYTTAQVDLLQNRIDSIGLPSHMKDVQYLLKLEKPYYKSTSIADVFPNEHGVLAIYTYGYKLNQYKTLQIVKEVYGNDKSPIRGSHAVSKITIVDTGPAKQP